MDVALLESLSATDLSLTYTRYELGSGLSTELSK